ncbi:MAG: hypothetical protein ACFFCT_12035 [Candidatus Odinarchaeota archaeon]
MTSTPITLTDRESYKLILRDELDQPGTYFVRIKRPRKGNNKGIPIQHCYNAVSEEQAQKMLQLFWFQNLPIDNWSQLQIKKYCECRHCQEGHIPVGGGIHIVTREMALDACEPEMEGMQWEQEPEWHMCGCCEGDWEHCNRCYEEERSKHNG